MNTFVLSQHIKIIQEFVDEYQLAISFREAGEPTIKRLLSGCACKGHAVLEKSVKEKTLNGALFADTISGNTHKLEGLIGHWEIIYDEYRKETMKLLGVYLSEFGVANFKKLSGFTGEVNDNVVSLCDALITLVAMDGDEYNRDIARCFLTGDYDVHDLLDMKKTTNRNPILQEEKAKKLLEELNQRLQPYINGEENDGNLENEYNVIRHGAQINYPIYMFEHEYGKALVLPVIVADTKIMMFHAKEKEVEFISNEELKSWYSQHRIPLKCTFNDVEISKAYELSIWFQSCYKTIQKAILCFEKLVANKYIVKSENKNIVYCRDYPENGISKTSNAFYQCLVMDALISHELPLKDIHWYDLYANRRLDKYKHINMKQRDMGGIGEVARQFVLMIQLDPCTRETTTLK